MEPVRVKAKTRLGFGPAKPGNLIPLRNPTEELRGQGTSSHGIGSKILDQFTSKKLKVDMDVKTSIGIGVEWVKTGLLGVEVLCGGVTLKETNNEMPRCIIKEHGQYLKELDSSRGDTYYEHIMAVQQVSDISNPNSLKQRPRVLGLQRDIDVLKSELLKFISEHE
ncbi:hypothetical protein NC653_020381 [Populus alba x Populus x berolinensis]|uniref:Uncharacterized protein n=1 Tax=Populus alba x Populus x berolinensis TaxID=444605 RepID=A0AAD6ML22_9ROSI|nr:hypothetical protein NC653_020381 [Populus alba x Populus x berolinensis]